MKKEIKARYRNKVGKIVIEVFNGEKWIYVKTLSNPLKEFEAECLEKVSCFKSKNNQINDQKFGQSLLNEVQKEDISPKKTNVDALFPSIEQIKKVVEENKDV